MPDITIRLASEADIPLIQELAGACYFVAYRGIHSEEQNRYMFDQMYATDSLRRQMDGGSRFLLLSEDSSPVAYCAYIPGAHGKPSDVYIDKLYILPERKGKGYGRMLVERVIAETRETGRATTVSLDVNRSNSACSFYEHLGFRVVSSWDREIGGGFVINAHTMTLELR